MVDIAASAEPGQHAWVVGVASVVFDIDQGQRLECLHPATSLSSPEVTDVAFHCKHWVRDDL